MAGIGHNSRARFATNDTDQRGGDWPPFDFFAFFDVIARSSATTTEKLLAIIRARHVGKSGIAYPSRERQMEMASCSPRTYTRAKPVADAFFHVDECRGRSAKYRPNTLVSVGDIEEAISAIRKQEETAKMASSAITRNGQNGPFETAKMASSEERNGQNGPFCDGEKGPKWPLRNGQNGPTE